MGAESVEKKRRRGRTRRQRREARERRGRYVARLSTVRIIGARYATDGKALWPTGVDVEVRFKPSHARRAA